MNQKGIVNVVTPTGSLAVMRPVAERLLASHTISGEIDGVLHAADAATVKAAIVSDGSSVCDFCSAPAPQHTFEVPDFDMTAGGVKVGTSTGGWAACDACAALVVAGKKRDLLERAVASISFAKFSRRAIGELHEKFWRGHAARQEATGIAQAIADYVEDRMADPIRRTGANTREGRIEEIARISTLSRAQVEALVGGQIDSNTLTRLAEWRARFNTSDHSALVEVLTGGPFKKPLPYRVPHWQRALDARFEALTSLSALMANVKPQVAFKEAVDVNDREQVRRITEYAKRIAMLRDLGYADDAKLLKYAATYSFNGETVAAIREAAQSIPHDAPLSSIETPNTGAGWFWFADPLPIETSSVASDHVHALLWGWVERLNPDGSKPGPAIAFSCYVLDERGHYVKAGTPAPSTRWFWPLHMTFHEMLAYNGQMWENEYGGEKFTQSDVPLMPKDETLLAVAEMSLFFVMACLWFRQTVPGTGRKITPKLTKDDGHVERHARKRYMREHDLKEPPTVQVVALRRTERTPVEDAPSERQPGAREYHCRWIVKGHTRLQPCGPQRADRKLIWIDAHPAGPEDKPLRTRERVYAVVR